MNILYFGYGSNMMTRRLLARCPGAKPVGVALAEGFDLTFWKAGKDGSGKGHLAATAGVLQPGVLFDIPDIEVNHLDKLEGVGNGYARIENFAVRCRETGKEHRAMTYLGTALDQTLSPFDWYLALVVTGAREHGFSANIISKLLATPCRSDPIEDRPTRLEAISLLQAAGLEIKDVLQPRAP